MLGVVLILFGCAICYCIIYEPFKILTKAKIYIPVQGMVEEYKPCKTPKGTTYYAIIKYEFSGIIYEKRSLYSTGFTPFLPKIGTPVDLKVNPNNPHDAIFTSFKEYWVLVFPLLIAIAFIVVGFLNLFKIID